MMRFLIHIIIHFYPFCLVCIAWVMNLVNFNTIVLGYLGICTFVYITTKTRLYYTSNDYNERILNLCPSIKNPDFKPYFLLPFDLVQMICLKLSKCNTERNIIVSQDEVNSGGVKVYWFDFEGEPIKGRTVLMLFPGITGKYTDEYVFNWAIEGLKQNYIVVVYQMRILSDSMTMPADGTINLLDDVEEAIDFINNKTSNKPIYAISSSFGANVLISYLGTRNKGSSKRIKAAVSISNPYDFLLAQRFGKGTIYEDIIVTLEKKNFKKSIISLNKQISNFLNEEKLLTADNVFTFDGNFFSKILGYRTADGYYRGISCVNQIANVDVPVLCINAKDDHIATANGIPYEEIEQNEHILLLVTDKGSHSCFAMNDRYMKIKQWLSPVFEFLKAVE